MSAPELKPCPFCGSKDVDNELRLDRRVHCYGCRADGPEVPYAAAAAPTWNTRADLPPTDAEVMAHPKVKALVEAVRRSVPALEDQEADMIVRGYNWTVAEQIRAALAAIQEDKP